MVKKEGRSVSEMMQEIFYMPTDEETVTLFGGRKRRKNVYYGGF